MERKDIMRRIRSADTGPERALRSLLWKEGFRFRKQYRVEGIRIDIAFPRPRVAVMVDGCFWHGCPVHYRRPQSRQDYWDSKLARNQQRDALNDQSLASVGWTVVRIWEHEPLADAMERVANVLNNLKGNPILGVTVASANPPTNDPPARQ